MDLEADAVTGRVGVVGHVLGSYVMTNDLVDVFGLDISGNSPNT